MRRLRQWMANHSEVTGILVFLLVVILVGAISYGVSYFTGGGKPQTVVRQTTEETGSPEESSEVAPETIAEIVESSENESTEASSAAGETTATTAAAQGTTANVGETINEYGVYFTIVDENVTAKIETNLRRVPSTTNDGDVVVKIYNGEWIKRTGIGHNGWSRVEYEGQVLYAVTSYLTGDGSSESTPIYEDVTDQVTAKEECFLRSSADSSSDENVVASLTNGTYVTRTGVGSNGWSRIDYNGTEVYAVTSLLMVQETQ